MNDLSVTRRSRLSPGQPQPRRSKTIVGSVAFTALLVVLSMLVWTPTSAGAQAGSVDIDIDLNAAGTLTSPGFTGLTAVNGASITIDGVAMKLFGVAGNRFRSGPGSALQSDFGFVDGYNASMGVRFSGLPVGKYKIESWHYDYGHPGAVDLEWRRVGGSSKVMTTNRTFQTSPAIYTVEVTKPGDYEFVVHAGGAFNRARLNGFRLTSAGPLDLDTIQFDVVSQADLLNKPGWAALVGKPGATATVQGVTATLFGFPNGNDRQIGPWTGVNNDFVFNQGANAGIGLRLTGLTPGRYQATSWHNDPNRSSSMRVELRKRGGSHRVLVDNVTTRTNGHSYTFDTETSGEYELVYREYNDNINVAVLNGFRIERQGDIPPKEPYVPEGDYELIAPDGAWTWFNDERAIWHNGYLYTGYVLSDGRYGVTRYNPVNKQSLETIISTPRSQEKDDHNNPSFTPLPDGRLLIVYAKHSRDKHYYYRISNNTTPDSLDDWGSELIHSTTDVRAVTYANTYRLSGENNRIYNFMRNINFNPTVTYSDDDGQTWSDPIQVIDVGTNDIRPYPKYWSDDPNRIDMMYSSGHPQTRPTSLYHMYYENQAFKATDGSTVKSFAALPLNYDAGERGTPIYLYNTSQWGAGEGIDDWIPGGRPWTWDIVRDGENPVVAFQVSSDGVVNGNGETRIFYYYARWTGTEWDTTMIAHGGEHLYDGQSDYGGGMAIDPENPNVVYISTNAAEPFANRTANLSEIPLAANGRYEIWKGVTADGGKTFTWTPITENSSEDNMRPIVPDNHGYDNHVIWFQGRYDNYLDWDTRVLGKFD